MDFLVGSTSILCEWNGWESLFDRDGPCHELAKPDAAIIFHRLTPSSQPVVVREQMMDLRDWKISALTDGYKEWLTNLPVSGDIRTLMEILTGFVLLWLIWEVVAFVTRRVFSRLLDRSTPGSIVESLFTFKVFDAKRARLFPTIAIVLVAPRLFAESPFMRHWVTVASGVFLTAVILLMIFRALDVFYDRYRRHEESGHFAIKSLVQASKVILFAFGAIAIMAILLERSPLLVLSGFGAITAVILLIFKDALLGLVAGIQLNINNMVRLGDWIQMPDDSANGTVVDIALTTIKVENFDKTLTCLPSYDLISKSFINWRGMTDSGGRRIKRAIVLDLRSIHFVDEEFCQKIEAIGLLQPFLKERREEIATFNRSQPFDTAHPANGRKLTNAGLFRNYVVAYLRARSDIRSDPFTFLVRHLQPTSEGLPIQLYIFTTTTDWADYEGIQADIFDHLIAVLPFFNLRVFQSPSGSDLECLRAPAGASPSTPAC